MTSSHMKRVKETVRVVSHWWFHSDKLSQLCQGMILEALTVGAIGVLQEHILLPRPPWPPTFVRLLPPRSWSVMGICQMQMGL